MYNGIGLQTPRGSGTNGYIQTNKFFVRPRGGKPSSEGRGFEDDQGTAGISKKPNKDILEHDRKRQIHLKLVVLEDKLIEQGYTDAEIADKLDEARKVIEAFSVSDSSGGLSGDAKHSDTQTHQIAARKERQMEVLRGALGIKMSDPEMEMGELVEDESRKSGTGDRREHAFLDRDYSWKKQEVIKDEKKCCKSGNDKKKDKGGNADELKRGGKRRNWGGSSESDGRTKRGRRERDARQKGKEESEDESDSDSDDGKRTRTRRKLKKSRSDSDSGSDSDSSLSEDSGSDSDSYKKKRISSRTKQRRHDSDSDDNSDSSDDDSDTRRKKKSVKQRRHSSEKDESGSDSDKSDSSGSDSDHKKAEPKKALKKSKTSSRRHDSDDDFSSASEHAHKTHDANKDLTSKRRHDSDSDSDADPKVQRKLKNNQLSGRCINPINEIPKKSRRHDSDDDGLDGGHERSTAKDMGRQVGRSKNLHRGERCNPRFSLEARKSAHDDDRRRNGHELMDRYQPEKDDEVELNYDRRRTMSKRKLVDDEQAELMPIKKSKQDDKLRGRDREHHKRDHYPRPERPTRLDKEQQPVQKPSQQSLVDDKPRDVRIVDYSRSARLTTPVDEISKYEGRVSKDENTGIESRRNDLTESGKHRSEKRNAMDEEDRKGKDFEREEVDDESKSKKRSARDEEDLMSRRYQKDEVDGRPIRFSRDEEEGRRGRGHEKPYMDEQEQLRNTRQRGREEEEDRHGRGLERLSRDEKDRTRNSRQCGRDEEEERIGKGLERREENHPRNSRQRGRDEEEERRVREGQLDHFKRPRYDKRNDDRAGYRD